MNRVTRALEGFSEVTDIKFKGEEELFVVLYQSKESLAPQMKSKIEGAVIASGTREFLGQVGGNRKILEKP